MVPASEQQSPAARHGLWFCSPNSTKLKDGSLKTQIRTEPKRTAASSVLNNKILTFHAKTVVRGLNGVLGGKARWLSCTPLRTTRTSRFLSPLPIIIISSHHRLILYCCPSPESLIPHSEKEKTLALSCQLLTPVLGRDRVQIYLIP